MVEKKEYSLENYKKEKEGGKKNPNPLNPVNVKLKKQLKDTSKISLVKQKRGRPNKIVADLRLKFVVDLILEGETWTQMKRKIQEELKISESSATGLIIKGNNYIKENITIDIQSVIISHIERYKEIFSDWKNVDGKTQIAALQSIEKLLKLHTPENQVTNNTLNINLKDLSVRELKDLLNS